MHGIAPAIFSSQTCHRANENCSGVRPMLARKLRFFDYALAVNRKYPTVANSLLRATSS